MKQIIVMISMILLGITIAGFVTDFGSSAESISNSANAKIKSITTSDGI